MYNDTLQDDDDDDDADGGVSDLLPCPLPAHGLTMMSDLKGRILIHTDSRGWEAVLTG